MSSLSRRDLLIRAGVGALGLVLLPRSAEALARGLTAPGASPVPMKVYKSATCGCCRAWVTYVNANGFAATVTDLDDGALRARKTALGVPEELRSCHTAVVGHFLIEGHVPADLIHRALREHAKGAGLTVPGMVSGSPGMEGGTPEPYDVLLFQKSGQATTYASR
jgi:hypothetical protein